MFDAVRLPMKFIAPDRSDAKDHVLPGIMFSSGFSWSSGNFSHIFSHICTFRDQVKYHHPLLIVNAHCPGLSCLSLPASWYEDRCDEPDAEWHLATRVLGIRKGTKHPPCCWWKLSWWFIQVPGESSPGASVGRMEIQEWGLPGWHSP